MLFAGAALALALPAAADAVAATASSPDNKTVSHTAQGRTWDSIKKLPDWSGVWVLSDESWTEAVEVTIDQDARLLPPFSAEYLAIRSAHIAAQDVTQFSNESKCIPPGIPESSAIPIGHEYLLTPGRVTVIFENGIVRRIDTSGRPHPRENELTPSFAGNSVGHWEGR